MHLSNCTSDFIRDSICRDASVKKPPNKKGNPIHQPRRPPPYTRLVLSIIPWSHSFAMSGIPPQPAEEGYEPKSALRNATTIGFQAGMVGAFVSAVQNALGSHSRGAAGFLTRSGGTIGTFGKRNNLACQVRGLKSCFILTAAMGAAFAFTEATVANQRETNDALNGIAGGCAAGFLAGLRSVLLHSLFPSFTSPVNLSTFNTGRTWFVRCTGCSYGHLRLCRRNRWQVEGGKGGEEKEVLQISTSARPPCFRVEYSNSSPHLFYINLKCWHQALTLAKHIKQIQQTYMKDVTRLNSELKTTNHGLST